MSERIRRRVVVRGIVQGVGYRYFTMTMAERFHIAGWVANQSNGTVLLEAEGSPVDVEQFQQSLVEGPRMAQVTNLEVEDIPVIDEHAFRMCSTAPTPASRQWS